MQKTVILKFNIILFPRFTYDIKNTIDNLDEICKYDLYLWIYAFKNDTLPSLDPSDCPRTPRAPLVAVDFAKRLFYRHKIYLVLDNNLFEFLSVIFVNLFLEQRNESVR